MCISTVQKTNRNSIEFFLSTQTRRVVKSSWTKSLHRLLQRPEYQSSLSQLLCPLHLPGPRAIHLQRGKGTLGSHVLQGRSRCQIVQESLQTESRHWYLSPSNLGWLQPTIPDPVLPGQCRSRHYQFLRGIILPPRESDSRWLLKWFPDLSLQCWIY